MELDSIKKIVQTEKEAKKIIENAHKEAETIIQNAYRSIEQKQLFSNKIKDETEQKIKAETIQAQKEKIAKIMEITETKCSELENQAKDKMQIAVDTIFKGVIS